MTIIRVRLDDEDRKRYGDDGEPLPERLLFDTDQLKDMTADELDRLERETDMALAGLLPHLEPTLAKLSFVRRAAAFLAVRQAGSEVSWDDFQPRLLRAEFVQEEGEAHPPAGPSEGSSED